MDEALKTILKFLADTEPEVSGRSAEPVSKEFESRILQFVQGSLPEDERQALCEEILHHRPAMELLVDRLKSGGSDH